LNNAKQRLLRTVIADRLISQERFSNPEKRAPELGRKQKTI
jgi:hypothetical protein